MNILIIFPHEIVYYFDIVLTPNLYHINVKYETHRILFNVNRYFYYSVLTMPYLRAGDS